METLGLVGFSIFMLVLAIGFVGTFFGIFGTLIILLASISYALITEFAFLSINVLVLLLILYLAGELLEYVFIAIGAKKLGASNKAIAGAIVGGIAGALLGSFLGGIGIIPMTFLGVFLGAFCVELVIKKDIIKSFKSGVGSILGRVGAIASKVLIALIMIAIILFHIFRAGTVCTL